MKKNCNSLWGLFLNSYKRETPKERKVNFAITVSNVLLYSSHTNSIFRYQHIWKHATFTMCLKVYLHMTVHNCSFFSTRTNIGSQRMPTSRASNWKNGDGRRSESVTLWRVESQHMYANYAYVKVRQCTMHVAFELVTILEVGRNSFPTLCETRRNHVQKFNYPL